MIANGDITSPEKAKAVLEFTAADGLMIGRAAQGNPWIFNQIKSYLTDNTLISPPENEDIYQTLSSHLKNLHQFYGEVSGVRIARKHIGWYIKNNQGAELFRQQINQVDDANTQLKLITEFFKLQPDRIAA